MKWSVLALLLGAGLASAEPLSAETLSEEIGRTGLAATETRLESVKSPGEADRFALGGVRFLATVEQALQTRWRTGLTDSMGMIPFLRLPIEENPAQPPFDPRVIANLFASVVTGMDAARMPLSSIPDTADFGVEIDLGDLWFDVNANGSRDPGEDLLDIAGPMLLGWQWQEREPGAPTPVVRFDAADAAWLSAYTHLLAGMSEVVLAYDPTGSIDRASRARAALTGLSTEPGYDGYDPMFGEFADLGYILLDALRQTPDKGRAASAHQHFLKMVADNRSFWKRVEAETDDDREWLPNDRQHSALGIELPPGTGTHWMAVLSDAEALLKGEKLIPYWRAHGEVGVDLGRLFLDPKPIDLIGWIQGTAAVPYLRKGPVVDASSLAAFEALMGGQAMLMSVFLN